jgi:hypothetical protein
MRPVRLKLMPVVRYVWGNAVLGYASALTIVAMDTANYADAQARFLWTSAHCICLLSFIGLLLWLNTLASKHRGILLGLQVLSVVWVVYCVMLGALFSGNAI